MNIEIQKWYGRLGNNIIQLVNAIHIAVHYNYNIILPKHNYFALQYIIINHDININSKRLHDQYFFFYNTRIKGINNTIFYQNKVKVYDILRSMFVAKPNGDLLENDVVIHIRSGDIFGPRPHPNYIMPPLSYYTDILNKRNFNRIIIVAEDNLNPCIPALLKLYPNSYFKKDTLSNDINKILGCRNIIESFGTFIPYILLFSNNIKHIYRPSYQFNPDYSMLTSHPDIHITDLNPYKKLLTPWINTTEQRDIMLNYSIL